MNHDKYTECYICLEKLYDLCDNLKCGCVNRYHTMCLDTWLLVKNKCPICKKKINENETQNKNDDEEDDEDDEEDDDEEDDDEEDDDTFELDLVLVVDDNNPLVYFISVYIVYFIVLFSINHFIYLFFMKK